jgi:hypothetical protein
MQLKHLGDMVHLSGPLGLLVWANLIFIRGGGLISHVVEQDFLFSTYSHLLLLFFGPFRDPALFSNQGLHH